MKTRLFFVAIVLMFIGYSCQDESTTESIAPTTTDDTPVMTKTDPGLDGPVQEFPLEMSETLKKMSLNDHPIVANEATEEDITTRSDYSIIVPSSIVRYLGCGSDITQTLSDNINRVSNSVYAHFGYATDLNGRDEIYRFTVTQSSVVTINLTNTSRNLAMVLFRGSVQNYPNSTYKLNLSSVVDVTNSSSEHSDLVGPVQLTPGTYILVIDSKINQSSSYRLRATCTAVNSGCVNGTNTLLADNFNQYQYGNVSPQSYYWEKWFSSSVNDAVVTGSAANKYLYLEHKSAATSANQPNVLWRHGYRSTSGNYAIKMSLYIPSNRSAYFSMQKRLTYKNTDNEYGARFFFNAGGQGRVLIGGSTYNFTYTPGTWMTIQLSVNFNVNRTYFYINNVQKANWACTSYHAGANGSKSIEALQFYPYASNSAFFVDNICFSKYW